MTTLLRLAVSLLIAMAASGCAHTVFVHEPPAGGFKVERPRYPLNAALTLAGAPADNTVVRDLLQRSGYFATLGHASSGAKNIDLDIAYRGVRCGDAESPSDTFIGTWFGTLKFVVVTVPTLGIVPPGASSERKCEQVFEYKFRAPRVTQPRAVQYPFAEVEYRTSAPGLYTNADKEKFQRTYLLDQSVAALLGDIAAQLRKN